MTAFNPTAVAPEEKLSQPGLKEVLLQCIDKFQKEKDEDTVSFEARKTIQKQIIDALPDDLQDQLESHLSYEKLITKDKEKRNSGKEVRPFDPATVLKGELFEKVVIAERAVKSEGEAARSAPIRELIRLLKKPSIQTMQAIGFFRKPDLIDMQEEGEGSLVLERMTEIKTHSLTADNINQITNFKSEFKKFEAAASRFKPLQAMGFSNIFPILAGGKIKFSSAFKVELVIPRDVNEDQLINKSSFNFDDQRIEEARQKIKNVDITRSIFSRDELQVLFKAAAPKVIK